MLSTDKKASERLHLIKQKGSILMVFVLILLVSGSSLMYSVLNNSPNKLRLGQTQKQLEQLENIRDRLLIFASNPDVFCAQTLVTGTNTRYLPLPWQAGSGGSTGTFFDSILAPQANTFDFTDEFQFGFEDLPSIDRLIYSINDNSTTTLNMVTDECNGWQSVFNFCLIDTFAAVDPVTGERNTGNDPDYVLTLRFSNESSPRLSIRRTDICPTN